MGLPVSGTVKPAKAIDCPMQINTDTTNTIYRVEGNVLEALTIMTKQATNPKCNIKYGYKSSINLIAILKTKKLDKKQAKTIQEEIKYGTYNGNSSSTVWDQAHTINFTVTQYYRDKKVNGANSHADYTHFDTTNLHINYKDSQVYAYAYFEYHSEGCKYRENYDGSFTFVNKNRYDSGPGYTYYNLSQGQSYSDYNKEYLWVDCGQPDYPFAMSDTYLHISDGHSSWVIRAQFTYMDSSMSFDTYTY